MEVGVATGRGLSEGGKAAAAADVTEVSTELLSFLT